MIYIINIRQGKRATEEDKMKKIEMCKAIAQAMENKKHSEFISVNQMAAFINRNFSLNDVKKMYEEIA